MGIFKRAKSPTTEESSTSSSTQALLVNRDANVSTSNLSSSSTLIPETANQRPRVEDYDAYVAQEATRQATLDGGQTERTSSRGKFLQRARAAGENSRHWPEDPWRGGFGPRAAEETREIGMDAWLRRNGLKK
jgi:hypothetical protein